jgi:glycosyltransferase involved in cell wall biosynthesis
VNSAQRSLNILQVSTSDILGGAEKVAWNLFKAYPRRGHNSWLAVGRKHSDDPGVLVIPSEQGRPRWTRTCHKLQDQLQRRGLRPASRLARWLALLGEPQRFLDKWRGIEDFHFPGTACLLDVAPHRPDVLHAHNLHGEYFDLRYLPWISQRVPMVITLHDAWLLSGHCAHSFECDRWKTGCGRCPDLTIHPAIRRDATAFNWHRKRELYADARLYVATPSRWLMQKVEQSMLAPAVVDARVIPNGVDLSVFQPADRQAGREAMGIPSDARVLLFTANVIRRNIWKDYETMRAAIALVAQRLEREAVLFIALGEDAPTERIGSGEVRFVAYLKDPEVVASYYQAADVYVHAAHADTFPNTVLEALACGTPVVATSVGGIPEQIEEGVTGFLTPPGDARAMAARIVQLLSDNALRERFAAAAADSARRRFDLTSQVDSYLAWYWELTSRHRSREVAAVGCGGGHD